jgi:transposase InsO family protein
VLQRLRARNLSICAYYSTFVTNEAKILGYQLRHGTLTILPEQTKALEDCKEPTSTSMIKSFLGLTNFFRGHIRDYADLAAPLNQLVKTGNAYKGGTMPDDARIAFQRLRKALLSDPVLALPRPDRQFAVIVDAATGSETTTGGLGAILSQIDNQGKFHAICYASRRLNDKENQYSPFLLEMAAAVWAIKTFKDHLDGHRFILFTDHKPLQKVALAQSKTLNEFQQLALQFDFVTQYKQGINMPADFLSRTASTNPELPVVNLVAAVSMAPADLAAEQRRSPDLAPLRYALQHGQLPPEVSKLLKERLTGLQKHSYVDVWRRIWTRLSDLDYPRSVLLAPASIRRQILQNAHDSSWAGHDGQDRAYARITTAYYWPGIKDDIAQYIKTCHICQKKSQKGIPPVPLQPLPVPDRPNQRVHVDLLGPLKSNTANKYILAITDAFTKIAILAPLPDKEAGTVAKALLHKWVYRFSAPSQIHSDQGKEFCNKVLQELLQLLGTSHTTTTAYHPQANAQVERLNRTILGYLRSHIMDDTLDWEQSLPLFEFHFNSSFHSSLHTTPFKMLYGHEETPSTLEPPTFKSHEERWTAIKTQQEAARGRQELQKHSQKKAHDKQAVPHQFEEGQQVLVRDHNFLGRNHKIAPHWIGPATIIKIQDNNAWIQMPRKPKRLVNVKELKPYQAESSAPMPFQEFFSQGEEQHQQSMPEQTTHTTQANQSTLISMASQLIQTIKNQTTASTPAQALIRLINQTQAITNQYLLGLYLKVLRSPFGAPDPLTSDERQLFESYQPWERNLYTTGDPLSAPEYRKGLCAMPGPTKNVPLGQPGPLQHPAAAPQAPVLQPLPPVAAPPAPMPPPLLLPGPAPAQAAGPAPAQAVGPNPAPPARPVAGPALPAPPARNRRMKRTVEPSDRVTRSRGPPEYGLLPETKRTRTPTKPTSAAASASDGNAPTAPASPAREPGFGLLRAVGRTLFGGATATTPDPDPEEEPAPAPSFGSFRFF